jgi:hypothetical protein
MLLTEADREQAWSETTLESPFAEAPDSRAESASNGFAAFSEAQSPFAEAPGAPATEHETDHLLAEALAELRDETFDEALAYLAEEIEQAVADRFTGESPANSAERERFADTHLAGVRFEAEQYLNALEAGLQGLDVASFSEQQLDEKLDQFDPQTGEVTPAGEEFIGALVRKAKKAVKFVANAAKSVASGVGKIAGAVLGPVLNRLKALIRPLLKRVLSFAIGRLPAPLQSVARTLAAKMQFEADEAEAEWEEEAMSPALLTDVEMLAEGFDNALAEAVIGEGLDELEMEGESYLPINETDGRQLERLAEARGALIDRLQSGDEAQVAPAMEQFIPVLLGALRLGVNLVGRSKVVNFLAGLLAKFIGKWVGPQLARPLSSAIVDTGLRLVALEAEDEMNALEAEAGPVALASVIEDTVRRLAEQEDYIFEDEGLAQLAAAEAFAQAVATHFPPQFVRPDLRQAASIGGAFVTRRPRSVRSYRKYSRAPEIEVTPQIADALPTFGGGTLGGALRAAGVTLPVRARLHIYQASPGTTLPAVARNDRTIGGGGRGYTSAGGFHPLTPAAAGVLLREPGLGVAVPPAYLRSRNRIAAGQRFYVVQPTGAGSGPALPANGAGRAAAARLAPSRAHIRVDHRRGRIDVRLFFSEAESQRIAQAIRTARGEGPLLQALVGALSALDRSGAGGAVLREDRETFEAFAGSGPLGRSAGSLRRRLRAWLLPALAAWTRTNAEAFARAAASPAAGVTVRAQLSSVPGLATIGGTVAPRGGGHAKPLIAITVAPGGGRT